MSESYAVLIVEDHDPLRHILLELIEQRGWRSYSADTGHTALQMARSIHLDFGILDMHLPGTSGLEVFQTIERELGPLPSIMMSGEATPDETAEALAAGVFTFLRKKA